MPHKLRSPFCFGFGNLKLFLSGYHLYLNKVDLPRVVIYVKPHLWLILQVKKHCKQVNISSNLKIVLRNFLVFWTRYLIVNIEQGLKVS